MPGASRIRRGQLTTTVRAVRTQPSRSMATARRVERSCTFTRTLTVATPRSSIRSATRGGRPGGALDGTLKRVTTGWAGAIRTPYSLPPASGADGACAAPAAEARAGCGETAARGLATDAA